MKKIKELWNGFAGPLPGTDCPPAAFTALFALALAAYAVLVCAQAAFDPLYSLYLDASNFYWIQAFRDRALFPGDALTAFYTSHLGPLNPESAWVRLTALFMGTFPYTLGLKFLAALAAAAAALLLRSAALASPARDRAGAAALLFCALALSMDIFFGVPRVYGALAVLSYAWALETRRFLLLPALTALCFVLYPAYSVGLAAASVLVPLFFREGFSRDRLLARYLAALGAAGAFCLLALSQSLALANARPGGEAGLAFEAQKLYQRVVSPLDPRSPGDLLTNFVFNVNEHGTLYAAFAALLLLLWGLGQLVAPGRPSLPRFLPPLLAGCGAAFLVLYPLHPVSASRQLVMAVPLALVFLGADGAARAFGPARPARLAALCALFFIALHPRLGETVSLRAQAPAFSYISGLPADSAVAAYPSGELAAALPVFSRRRAWLCDDLADQELLLLGEAPAARAVRRRALLDALYCARPGAEAELAAQGAGWLVFEKKYYSDEFLGPVREGRAPKEAGLGAALAAGGDPAACYEAARARAALEWDGPGGGVIVRIKNPAAGGSTAPGK